MYEKLKNSDDLYDHELLEILLFNACPRVNTNPIAHALLDRFVTLSEVFNAPVEELKQVEGVGDSIAKFIKTVGVCAERAGSIGNAPALKTSGDCRQFIDLRLKGKTEEHVELYLLSKSFKVQRILKYSSYEKSRAGVEKETIAKDISILQPYGIIIAHNHLNGSLNPSERDGEFTCFIQFICNMNGIKLLDHIIYVDRDNMFSYREGGLLDRAKDLCGWGNFEKWIKTLN